MVCEPNEAENECCRTQVRLGKQGHQRKKEGVEQGGIGTGCYRLSLHRGTAHHRSFWGDGDRHKEQPHQGRTSSCARHKVIVKCFWNHGLTSFHSCARHQKAVNRREHFTTLGPMNQVLSFCRLIQKLVQVIYFFIPKKTPTEDK